MSSAGLPCTVGYKAPRLGHSRAACSDRRPLMEGALTVTFANTANVFDSVLLAIAGAGGAAFANVGGNPFLYVSGNTDDGISAFAVSAAGQLTSVAGAGGTVVDGAGLALDGAWHLASLSIGSSTFIYGGGLDDGGVSAFQLQPNGAMVSPVVAGTVRDADSVFYELDRPYDVRTVTVGPNSYLIAAGATDDGISSF